MEHDEKSDLALLALELGKSFIRQTEPQDAIDAFENAVRMFEHHFEEELPLHGVEHERYVEALLHLAKLLHLSAQGNPEHIWKKCISHATTHLGRDCYPNLMASLGLSEFYLDQLKLAEADRWSEASVALARELEPSQEVRQRLVEGLSLQGVAQAQRQETERALEYYAEALEELEALEKEQDMDAWMQAAFNNLYRNMEHGYRGLEDEESANEWKKKRDTKLMTLADVTMEEPEGLKKHY